MEGFFVSIIFLGIVIVIFSIFLILIEKNKGIELKQKLDDKSYDLAVVLEDAEMMIEEMDKFSEYIVNKISDKQQEAEKFLEGYQEKFQELSSTIAASKEILNSTIEEKNSMNHQVVAETSEVKQVVETVKKTAVKKAVENQASKLNHGLQKEMILTQNSNIALESNALGKVSGENFNGNAYSDKVIPLNPRHKDVITLNRSGLSNTEIAKKLNIGKGEIELILGLHR